MVGEPLFHLPVPATGLTVCQTCHLPLRVTQLGASTETWVHVEIDADHTHKFVAGPFAGRSGDRHFIFCETCGEIRGVTFRQGQIVNS